MAIEIVRNAAVAALATVHPSTAARFWPGHPSVELSLGMAEIGLAARERRPIGAQTFAAINDAATKSPLSPEPFLVRGVQAQVSGDEEAAKRAFLEAQWRDPRSLPAAYFLANYYFRTGDALNGLEQTAVLARLSPGGVGTVAPFIAAYAQARSNWAQIRALLRSQPLLEEPVLTLLAQDPRNTEAILAFADPHRAANSTWVRTLLGSLVAAGDYSRARQIWLSMGGGKQGGQLLYDASFSDPKALPPFNWSLGSSAIGVAERQPGNRLNVVFYGNVDGVLASELLMLPAGTYQLQTSIAGGPVHAETLRWSVRCDKTDQPLATVTLDTASSRPWQFVIPANCAAQWLELSGRSGDIAQQADVTISGLKLTRVGGNA